MERPQKELYIRSTVAEILHDLCLDTEVAPSQRKFERKKMSRYMQKHVQETWIVGSYFVVCRRSAVRCVRFLRRHFCMI